MSRLLAAADAMAAVIAAADEEDATVTDMVERDDLLADPAGWLRDYATELPIQGTDAEARLAAMHADVMWALHGDGHLQPATPPDHEVLAAHTSHFGWGGNIWNAKCLGCDWRESGRGSVDFARRAFDRHLARALLAATVPTPDHDPLNTRCDHNINRLHVALPCTCAAPAPDEVGLVEVLAAHRLWWIGPYVAKCSCKQWRSTRDAQAEHDAHLAKAMQDARGSLLPALQPTSGPEDQCATDDRRKP